MFYHQKTIEKSIHMSIKDISAEKSQLRPELKLGLNHQLFMNFYWLKQELLKFCRDNKLSTTGSKIELTKRIYNFLETGSRDTQTKKSVKKTLDSINGLTLDTRVINYKNDAITRQFFKKHIGNHFHFNSYLRKFTNKNFIDKLTYGDLIKGWIAEEARKKSSNYKANIDKQFQYNQFIQDFFINEKNKTLQDAIKAWNIVKTSSGVCNYEHYKQIISLG
ncbi:MAG: cytoplasmic protein [Burkholderiales bacterium]|jgi:hypothetical protein|nr:cytoplasmic protein [Burkholderiales bacterium]